MECKERRYTQTHSWIKFELDMREVSYKMWLLFGAAESKCQHLRGIPLRPAKQEELNRISLKKGVRATTAIEGNTLSAEDVDKVYSGKGGELPQSRAYQVREIQNMLKVYNGVADEISVGHECEVSYARLLSDNAEILSGLSLKEEVIPGIVRTYPVGVVDYLGAPAEDCDYLLDRLFNWLASDWGLSIEHPLVEGILKAIMAHLYIAWIHPFGDGNGRGARVLEFRLLMNAGVPLTAAHLLTSYYNDTRHEYYEKLRRSSRIKDGELEFIEYALQGFVDGLDSEIGSILEEQLNVTWENYVYEVCFGGTLTPALRRRRNLLLAISKFEHPLLLSEMKYRLPSKILKQYQGSVKTLPRDINYLHKLGLVYATEDGYIAAKDMVKAFLPLSSH